MSIAPLPKFSTLHLSVGRVKLFTVLPTIDELGRLHLTSAECREIQRKEKEDKKMAFSVVDKAKLPVVQMGRVAPTSPSVVVTEAGAIVFNSFFTKMLSAGEVDRILLMRDDVTVVKHKQFGDCNSIAVVGIKKNTVPKGVAPESLFTLSYANKKDAKGVVSVDDSQSSLRGIQAWLRDIGYDFKTSGTQRYEGNIADKPAKGCLIFNLPKKAPAARPKQVREKKEKVAGKESSAPVVPVADEELVLEG